MTARKRVRVYSPTGGESMTEQHHTESCDINNILKGYEKTGIIRHVREGGQYVDLPDAMDYQDALNLMHSANESFAGLPAKTRREFDNDPEKFLAFVENPANVTRMGELGLLAEIQETDPGSVPKTTTPPATTPSEKTPSKAAEEKSG